MPFCTLQVLQCFHTFIIYVYFTYFIYIIIQFGNNRNCSWLFSFYYTFLVYCCHRSIARDPLDLFCRSSQFQFKRLSYR